jgi:hypothetical protein
MLFRRFTRSFVVFLCRSFFRCSTSSFVLPLVVPIYSLVSFCIVSHR